MLAGDAGARQREQAGGVDNGGRSPLGVKDAGVARVAAGSEGPADATGPG